MYSFLIDFYLFIYFHSLLLASKPTGLQGKVEKRGGGRGGRGGARGGRGGGRGKKKKNHYFICIYLFIFVILYFN